jgi:hypothetical protein
VGMTLMMMMMISESDNEKFADVVKIYL